MLRQGGFARAGVADEGQKIPPADGQRYIAKRGGLEGAAGLIGMGYMLQRYFHSRATSRAISSSVRISGGRGMPAARSRWASRAMGGASRR